MRRRTFLELLAIGTVAAPAALAQEIVPKPPQKILLTITGVNARTDTQVMGALLGGLLAAMVPVNLVVETLPGPSQVTADSDVARFLTQYLYSFPGLVEVVGWCPDLGTLAPYQAARTAHETLDSLIKALPPPPGSPTTRPNFVSIACKAPLDSAAASATLASGFRNVIQLSRMRTVVQARLDDLGLMSLLGGEERRIEDVAAALTMRHPGYQRQFILAAAEIEQMPADTLLASALEIGRVLKAGTLNLSMVSMLLGDVQYRSEAAFHRRIALHVLEPAPGDAAGIAGFASLCEVLRAQGVSFSSGSLAADTTGADGNTLAYWVPLDLPADGRFDPDRPFTLPPEEALLLPQKGALTAGDPRFGIIMRSGDGTHTTPGLTADATLQLPLIALIDTPEKAALQDAFTLDSRQDGLLVVASNALIEPVLRSAFVLALRRIIDQAESRILSLAEYCAEILPKDPLLPGLLLTRSAQLKPAAPMLAPAADERADLMEDAQRAWTYFDRYSISSTGLCPVTMVMGESPYAGFTGVSMWEMGSLFNALMAAVDLGFMAEEEFENRCRRILSTLERATQKRLVLPPETIDAKTGKGTTRFNSYDTGRLMVALHRLNQHPLAPKGIEKLVKSWDFASVLVNRRLHSYRSRELVDDSASNYADYAASGLRLWGLDVASPFDGLDADASADDQARLLTLTVSFGLLAAEPSYLQMLEMPGSPNADFLSACVDAIQNRLAEINGTPAAPSETPLDHSPWFTYQGFDMRNLADPWMVEFRAKTEDTASQKLALTLRATSSKAAYLWHALRPNAHSAALVQVLRREARREYGYDSAYYFDTRTSTAGYTDLNTNAVILQACAHMLQRK